MDDSNELIPCPWCGEQPELVESTKRGFAYCCGETITGSHYIETKWCESEAEARNVWNKRKC